jgi:hypothetical protein
VQTGMGVPQELGRSCRLHEKNPGRGYRATNPRLATWHPAVAGAKLAECARGTVKRRQRSAAGRAAGSRSASIVPRKPGNSTHENPGDGKRGTEVWNRCWEIRRMPRNSTSVTLPLQRVNVLNACRETAAQLLGNLLKGRRVAVFSVEGENKIANDLLLPARRRALHQSEISLFRADVSFAVDFDRGGPPANA